MSRFATIGLVGLAWFCLACAGEDDTSLVQAKLEAEKPKKHHVKKPKGVNAPPPPEEQSGPPEVFEGDEGNKNQKSVKKSSKKKSTKKKASEAPAEEAAPAADSPVSTEAGPAVASGEVIEDGTQQEEQSLRRDDKQDLVKVLEQEEQAMGQGKGNDCRDETYASLVGQPNPPETTCATGLECVGFIYDQALGTCQESLALKGSECRDATYASKSGESNPREKTCGTGLECAGYVYNLNMGTCREEEVTYTAQQLRREVGHNSKCVEEQGSVVEDQDACRELAMQREHKFISFKKNDHGEKGRCITTESCESPLHTKHWKVYHAGKELIPEASPENSNKEASSKQPEQEDNEKDLSM